MSSFETKNGMIYQGFVNQNMAKTGFGS